MTEEEMWSDACQQAGVKYGRLEKNSSGTACRFTMEGSDKTFFASFKGFAPFTSEDARVAGLRIGDFKAKEAEQTE